MTARYPGRCALTGCCYSAGTEIENNGYGWIIAAPQIIQPAKKTPLAPQVVREPLEAIRCPVAFATIPGVRDLIIARDEAERYRYEFEEMMADEFNDGAIWPKQPKTCYAEIYDRYPLATRWLTCYEECTIGMRPCFIEADRAIKAIEGGADATEALDAYDAACRSREPYWD